MITARVIKYFCFITLIKISDYLFQNMKSLPIVNLICWLFFHRFRYTNTTIHCSNWSITGIKKYYCIGSLMIILSTKYLRYDRTSTQSNGAPCWPVTARTIPNARVYSHDLRSRAYVKRYYIKRSNLVRTINTNYIICNCCIQLLRLSALLIFK